MNTFASKTRNVHKEIKENLSKTDILLSRYTKIINQGPRKTAQTVGRETTLLENEEKQGGPLMSTLAKIQEQLTVQQGSIDQQVVEQNRKM